MLYLWPNTLISGPIYIRYTLFLRCGKNTNTWSSSLNEPKISSLLIEVRTGFVNMQNIRNSILSHLRLRVVYEQQPQRNVFKQLYRQLCASSGTCPDEIMDRVIGLVKKFDKMDASKVTKTADFQKDLGLDSLDRVELVMAFEQEFSIGNSDEKADKLTCCADVAKYIASVGEQKISDS